MDVEEQVAHTPLNPASRCLAESRRRQADESLQAQEETAAVRGFIDHLSHEPDGTRGAGVVPEVTMFGNQEYVETDNTGVTRNVDGEMVRKFAREWEQGLAMLTRNALGIRMLATWEVRKSADRSRYLVLKLMIPRIRQCGVSRD